MSFNDELSRIADDAYQEIDKVEKMKKEILQYYPNAIKTIKDECLHLAKVGHRKCIVEGSKKFHPCTVNKLSAKEAREVQSFMYNTIYSLLKAEGFSNFEINICEIPDGRLSFWDEKTYHVHINYVIIKW